MGYRDGALTVATDQADSGGGTKKSGDSIPITTIRNIGAGEPVEMSVSIDVVLSTGTATFQLVTSAVTGLTSETVLMSTGAIAAADLTAGTRIALPFPQNTPEAYLAHVGVQVVYSVSATMTWSAGVDVDQATV